MTYVAIALAVGWMSTVVVLSLLINRLHEQQAEERRQLYNRIQAPNVEIARPDPKLPPGDVEYVDEAAEYQLQER